MKRILMMATLVLVAVSCAKTPKNSPVPATVTLQMDGSDYLEKGVTIALRDQSSSAAYEATTDETGTATFNVLPGLYEAVTQFKKAGDGKAYVYNGVNSNVVVVKDAKNAFTIEIKESVTNQVVIKEFYFGGCTSLNTESNETGTFQNDSYVILYNNSDQPADASDFCFAAINPANSNATNKYREEGVLKYEAEGWLPAGQAIWWFETTVTIPPYSQILVAITGAVDHTVTYPGSVDLSNADYVCYDPESGFNKEKSYPAPSNTIPVANYLQTAPYSAGTAWTLSVSSPAFVVFKHSDPNGLSNDTAAYDNTGGTKFPCVKVPVESVVDAVEVYAAGQDDKNGKRLTADIDAGYIHFSNKLGYTLYRNVDVDATKAIPGNAEKLVYNYAGGTADIEDGSTDTSGIDAEASIKNGAVIIYQDTNNSSKDFHQRKVSSLK